MGVPVPEVLAVGEREISRPYTILSKINGRSALSLTDRADAAREMGRYASIIHSIPTNGLGGKFDWLGEPQPRNTERFLFEELELDHRLSMLGKYADLETSRLNKIRATLIDLYDEESSTSLNHGDLRLKNILLNEEGEIAAILDWEHCTSNLAPTWDLAIALHDLSIDEKVAFVEGYGLGQNDLSRLAPAVKALNLIHYGLILEKAAMQEDVETMRRSRMHLSGDLDLYSLAG